MKSKGQGVFKSFLEYFYGNFIVLLLGFISLPLITRLMSTDEYGRTSIFQSVVSIIYIFAILGLDQGYIRYFYSEGVNKVKLFWQCVLPPFGIITLLSIVYFIGANRFNMLLFEKTGHDITILVIGYCVISVFERIVFLNIRMEQNGKLYSNLNILSKVLYITFIVLFVRVLGDDFRVVLYALTLPLLIVTVGLLIRFIIKSGKDELRNEATSLTEKELLKYSVPFIPMLLMEWLLTSMDKWSIRIFNGFSETGIYGAAMQIMVIISTIKITFVAFWSPIAMEKYENESEENCKSFFEDIFMKVQFLCMSIAFGLTIFRGIIVLILGEKYRDAIQIIPFLALMPVLSLLFEMTGQGVKFTKKIKYFNYASAAAIVCNLLGNTILVPIYKGVGAAIATGITYIVYFAIGTYFSNKCYPVNYKLKTFVLSLILYIGYAAFATVTGNQILSAGVGLVVFLVHMLVNLNTVKDLINIGLGMIVSLKKSS